MLKGVVENIISLFNISADYIRSTRQYLHPGKSAEVEINGKNYGFIGELHPNTAERLDIREKTVIAELNIQEMIEDLKQVFKYQSFSKFPGVYKDLSVTADKEVQTIDMIKELNGISPIVEEVHLYDVYSGKGVEEGKISLTFRAQFSDKEKTLTDDETNALLQKMIDTLGEKFGAKLR